MAIDPNQLESYYNYIINNPDFLNKILKDAVTIHRQTDGTIRTGVCFHCKTILIDQYGDVPSGVEVCDQCRNTFCIEDCLYYYESSERFLCGECKKQIYRSKYHKRWNPLTSEENYQSE